MSVRFLVPDVHPALPGHFPGNPLVPGVVILEAAVQAVSERLGPGRVVRGVRAVKFLRPLRPGEVCHIELRASRNGWCFEVLIGTASERLPVATGELEVE